MKKHSDIAQNVIRRRDEYIGAKKRTKKIAVTSLCSLCICCLAAVIIVSSGVLQQEPINAVDSADVSADSSNPSQENSTDTSTEQGEFINSREVYATAVRAMGLAMIVDSDGHGAPGNIDGEQNGYTENFEVQRNGIYVNNLLNNVLDNHTDGQKYVIYALFRSDEAANYTGAVDLEDFARANRDVFVFTNGNGPQCMLVTIEDIATLKDRMDTENICFYLDSVLAPATDGENDGEKLYFYACKDTYGNKLADFSKDGVSIKQLTEELSEMLTVQAALGSIVENGCLEKVQFIIETEGVDAAISYLREYYGDFDEYFEKYVSEATVDGEIAIDFEAMRRDLAAAYTRGDEIDAKIRELERIYFREYSYADLSALTEHGFEVIRVEGEYDVIHIAYAELEKAIEYLADDSVHFVLDSSYGIYR